MTQEPFLTNEKSSSFLSKLNINLLVQEIEKLDKFVIDHLDTFLKNQKFTVKYIFKIKLLKNILASKKTIFP